MKESSVLQEENITKKLVADYSKFREAIYNNLVKNHSGNENKNETINNGLQPIVNSDNEQTLVIDKLTLFKKNKKTARPFPVYLFCRRQIVGSAKFNQRNC